MTTWAEHEHHEQAIGSMPIPRPTVAADVTVPALQALLIGAALGIGATALLYLVGCRWGRSWRWGAALGVSSWAICLVLFMLQHRGLVIEPIRLAWARFDWLTRPRAAVRQPTSAVVINPLHSRTRRPEQVRQVAAGGQMLQAHATGPGAYEATVAALDVDQGPDNDTRELYTLITCCWPGGSVSRARAIEAGISRAAWHRYIGGARDGQGRESDRGLLDRAGAVALTAHGWIPTVPMSAAFCATDALRRYAHSQRACPTDRRRAGGPGHRSGQAGPGTPGVIGVFKRIGGGE